MQVEKQNKIKKTLLETKERRNLMSCKVVECKIDFSTLSQKTIEHLNKLFLESKWLYNSIIASQDISSYDTKINEVEIKIKDNFEQRKLENISAQMKQGVKTRIFNSLSTLKALKKKGYKVGKLKFKSQIKCIPLKQHTQTFTILKHSKRIKIQGIKQPLRVNGLNQLPKESYEIANANLVKIGKDFYVKITIFVPKENKIIPNNTIGIDFGCETQLTLSNGEKIKFQVPINKRVKKLDQELARKPKSLHSKNRQKVLEKREKVYQELTNKRNEIKNQIVNKLVKNYKIICFQDESLNQWKENNHGKKIQFSAIGGIISALKRKAVTPIVINKYYPSSQLCNKCGHRHSKKMEEKIRIYKCEKCGEEIDRDINAAKNIEKEGLNNLVPMEYREIKPVEIKTSLVNLAIDLSKV